MTYRTDGWTPCGSGGGSDCPELLVTPSGRIGIRSGQDQSDFPATLEFDGHEIAQLVEAYNKGEFPESIQAVIDADVKAQSTNSVR